MEITENGKVYLVTGDYPDGRYCKQIKEKGKPKSRTQRVAEAGLGVNLNADNIASANAKLDKIMVFMGIER